MVRPGPVSPKDAGAGLLDRLGCHAPKVSLAKTGMGIWLRCIGASFNSEQLLILENVLDEVCDELKLNDDLSRAVKELDWRQERLALEIIQTAAQGEWEPDQIKLTALKRWWLKPSPVNSRPSRSSRSSTPGDSGFYISPWAR